MVGADDGGGGYCAALQSMQVQIVSPSGFLTLLAVYYTRYDLPCVARVGQNRGEQNQSHHQLPGTW